MAIDSTLNKIVVPDTGDSAQQSQEQSIEQERISADRNENSDSQNAVTTSSSSSFSRPQVRQWWKFKLRPPDDDEDQDWWFASTAIPLLAATIGPLANVTSIAALVTYWRQDLIDLAGEVLSPLQGIPIRDPKWTYWLNVVSLICGFLGNIFLLLNFTQVIRYIIALPMTIILWYFASGIHIGIISAMHVYYPPLSPDQGYTQGFWFAIISAILYLTCSIILMINMLGYFLGHYPQHFTLTDYQRTLILQTMLFFIWLAGGGALFAYIERNQGEVGWAFVDGLYFCDATILTIGYGDLVPTVDVGRGLVFPYSVIGTVMLGLVIASFTRFLADLGENKVVKHHAEKKRIKALQEADTIKDDSNSKDLPSKSTNVLNMATANRGTGESDCFRLRLKSIFNKIFDKALPLLFYERRTIQALQLHDSRARFREMRRIQESTNTFKRYTALIISIITFNIVWAGGAIVFWQAEKSVQDMTYFRALYFCYVSLLTIGYGDLAPKSTAGRPFFVVWSLVAVPIMTILISSMSDTVIMNFKDATFYIGDLLVLPTKAAWAKWLYKFRWIMKKTAPSRQNQKQKMIQRWQLENSQQATEDEISENNRYNDHNDLDEKRSTTSRRRPLSDSNYAFRLATAIQRVTGYVKSKKDVKFSYDEWAEFISLFQFLLNSTEMDMPEGELDDSQLQWDWIGEKSPLMSNQSEAEFVLDKLLESLINYSQMLRKQHRMQRAQSSIRSIDRPYSHEAPRQIHGENDVDDGNAQLAK